MLNYSNSDQAEKDIVISYAKRIGSSLAEEFFSGERSLANIDEALEVAKAFGEITDLASTDHLNNISNLGSIDVEFGMHKLFNKIYGYYERNGFKEQWKIAENAFG